MSPPAPRSPSHVGGGASGRAEAGGRRAAGKGRQGTQRPAQEMTPQAASTAESTVPSSPARGAVWWRLRDGRQNCLHPAASQRGRSMLALPAALAFRDSGLVLASPAPAVSDGAGALTRVARVTSDGAGNKWLLYRSPSLWDIYIRETLCSPQKESGRGHKTLKGALFTKCTSPRGRPRVLSDMPLTGARAQGHAPTGAARVPSGSNSPSAPHGITRTR